LTAIKAVIGGAFDAASNAIGCGIALGTGCEKHLSRIWFMLALFHGFPL